MRSPTRIDTSRTLVGPGCPLPRNSSFASTESDVETPVHFPELIQGEEAGVSLGALVAGEVGLGDAGQLCDRLLGEPTLLSAMHRSIASGVLVPLDLEPGRHEFSQSARLVPQPVAAAKAAEQGMR
jgi:hypothetical protein